MGMFSADDLDVKFVDPEEWGNIGRHCIDQLQGMLSGDSVRIKTYFRYLSNKIRERFGFIGVAKHKTIPKIAITCCAGDGNAINHWLQENLPDGIDVTVVYRQFYDNRPFIAPPQSNDSDWEVDYNARPTFSLKIPSPPISVMAGKRVENGIVLMSHPETGEQVKVAVKNGFPLVQWNEDGVLETDYKFD